MSQGVIELPDRGERRDALDQRLAEMLSLAGYAPLPVPNSLSAVAGDEGTPDPVEAWMRGARADALVLSGGADIGAFPERDRTETKLLAYARANSLPVLGICRGMQMMAVWSGVELTPVSGHAGARHRLTGELCDEVNSYHNLGLANCPAGFAVTARSEDGCIEAIRNDAWGWEGWMWHPEREPNFEAGQLRRLRTLFDRRMVGRPVP